MRELEVNGTLLLDDIDAVNISGQSALEVAVLRDGNETLVWDRVQAQLPGAVLDFAATDAEPDKIRCTWTDGATASGHDLYADGLGLIALDLTGGIYDWIPPSFAVFKLYVIAKNNYGSTISNKDDGQQIDAAPITTFAASDDLLEAISFTWFNNPIHVKYTLYFASGAIFRDDVTPGHIEILGPDYVNDFFVKGHYIDGKTTSSAIDTGSTVAKAPTAIIDFAATGDVIENIICTWTPAVGTGAITHSLYYGNDILVTANVSSPYTWGAPDGTLPPNPEFAYDLYVIATNEYGSTKSNVDQGYALAPIIPDPPGSMDFATTTTWTSPTGHYSLDCCLCAGGFSGHPGSTVGDGGGGNGGYAGEIVANAIGVASQESIYIEVGDEFEDDGYTAIKNLEADGGEGAMGGIGSNFGNDATDGAPSSNCHGSYTGGTGGESGGGAGGGGGGAGFGNGGAGGTNLSLGGLPGDGYGSAGGGGGYWTGNTGPGGIGRSGLVRVSWS